MASFAELFGLSPIEGSLFPVSEEAQKQAQGMGILQSGLGILANSRGKSLGQALGAGGMMGLQGYNTQMQTAQQNQMMQAMRAAQMAKFKQEQDQRGALESWIATLPPEQQALARANPAKFAELSAQRTLEKPPTPQMVTVQTPNGPVQRWVRPGETEGVDVGPQYREALDPAARQAKIDDRVRMEQAINPLMIERQAAGRPVVSVDARPDNLGLTPKNRFDMEQKIAGDYQQESKVYNEIKSARDRFKAAFDAKGGIRDMAAVYGFAKILDPTSVVRESEYGAVLNTAGLADKLQNYVNKLTTGQFLTNDQRKEMENVIDSIYGRAMEDQKGRRNKYAGIASQYNLNVDNVTGPMWNLYGYKSKTDAVKDAKNALMANPGARDEVVRRLEEMGITDHGLR